MRQKRQWKLMLQILHSGAIFFGLVALLVTCTMSLFVEVLSRDLHMVFTEDHLNRAAKLTFACVLVLSILFTLIDVVRRKMTTERVTKHLASAAKELVQGNFDVRIEQINRLSVDESFNEVIDCFNKMAKELESVETLRTDFIANVSHEMKTPLSAIQNYGVLLQTPDLPEEKRLEYAKGVTEGTRKMANMMTNILKLNRLENQQIFPKTTTYNLGEQVCECLLAYEAVWEEKEIELETRMDDSIFIEADRELLGLVWNNLLSNAFKFTPPNGKVTVQVWKEEGTIRVQVTDTGCGMSPEVGAHIFEKFYQGDTSHATEGNGLGLALVKRVVDILHGEIYVESTLEKGTLFEVQLKGKQEEEK